jgi:enoyl-[acyl-carrier protein] reductase I
MGPDGVRVNAISAGPLRTLAAAGVGGFNHIASHVAEKTPLRTNIDQDDVADTALYLCSDMSKKVTGGVHFVDSGFNIIGM